MKLQIELIRFYLSRDYTNVILALLLILINVHEYSAYTNHTHLIKKRPLPRSPCLLRQRSPLKI